MKNLINYFLITLLFFSFCKKAESGDGTPACIRHKIISFEKDALCSDPSVDEYEFQSKTVYVFSPGSCGADLGASVYDSNCNNLGGLGGLRGNTQIEGQDFSTATFIKTIWEK